MGKITLAIEPTGKTFDVYELGIEPEHSVRAGLEFRRFIDSFKTYMDAHNAYPKAVFHECGLGPVTPMSSVAPSWFDPADAGESWDED
jgi:hypothetical protein